MTVREFLADRLVYLIVRMFGMAAAAVFLLATGTGYGIVYIICTVWLLLFTAGQGRDFFRYRRHLKELENIMEGLDRKYLFAECAPKPQSAYERRLFHLNRRSGKSMIESVSDAHASQREYREYVESWVHEIKTPLTAARLLCRGAEPELRRKLTHELTMIDNHVERALFYARAESPEKDFLIRRTSLAEITTKAIAHHQSLLIESGVRIETEDLNHTVYTDSKWAAFILGQLLQNAVRYRSASPVISISALQQGSLVQMTFYDNGIGIPPGELSRVFDRGFTGSNGRSRGGSTGIGLYLCRRLSDFLQIDIRIQSEESRGTWAFLTFPAQEFV